MVFLQIKTLIREWMEAEGALMPRRLKLRQSYMVGENGTVEKADDLWFKSRKNSCKTKKSWVGFTLFWNKAANLPRELCGGKGPWTWRGV